MPLFVKACILKSLKPKVASSISSSAFATIYSRHLPKQFVSVPGRGVRVVSAGAVRDAIRELKQSVPAAARGVAIKKGEAPGGLSLCLPGVIRAFPRLGSIESV